MFVLPLCTLSYVMLPVTDVNDKCYVCGHIMIIIKCYGVKKGSPKPLMLKMAKITKGQDQLMYKMIFMAPSHSTQAVLIFASNLLGAVLSGSGFENMCELCCIGIGTG